MTIGLSAAAAAVGTALLVLLGQREAITSAAIVMDPETGQTVTSQIAAGYSYPAFSHVVTLAMVAAGLVVAASVAWLRRSELISAIQRSVRPELQDEDPLTGDTLGMLDHAIAERLD
jgi:hypothetical protein